MCPSVCVCVCTFAEGVEVEHTAGAHHSLQRDDLVQRDPEELVLVEASRGRVVRLMRPEVMMSEGKPLPSAHKQRKRVLQTVLNAIGPCVSIATEMSVCFVCAMCVLIRSLASPVG